MLRTSRGGRSGGIGAEDAERWEERRALAQVCIRDRGSDGPAGSGIRILFGDD